MGSDRARQFLPFDALKGFKEAIKERQKIKVDKIELSDKTKKVYNILGDTPEVVGKYLVDKMISNKKNHVKINWLTNRKAFFRFLTAGFHKRDFFKDK